MRPKSATIARFIFAALTTAIPVAASAQPGGERRPPNIIFIMVDDLGYGDLGCYGQRRIQTPHIDKIAAEGTRFTNCYAGSPVCAPSRCVLMTGLHTGHCTVRGNTGQGGVVGLGGASGRVPLRDEDVTVAEILKTAHYATGIVGKWGLGEPSTTGLPLDQGFDHWFGFLNQRRAHSHFPEYLWLHDQRFALPGNAGGRHQQYAHDLFTSFAMHFIRQRQAVPFFLYLPYTVPHDKFQVPDLGPYVDRDWTEQEKTYAAMITRMDSDVGRIAALLDELQLTENTLLMFCSDNGAANRYTGVFDSSGPLRGRKRDMYEGGIRTPMIVRWPGRTSAGATSDAPWYFADLLPTLAEVAGAAPPSSIDGVSVLPTLLGQTQPELNQRLMYWEFFEGGFQQAARRGPWKCVRRQPHSRLELYDLESDPSETVDVAAEHADIIASFEASLASVRSESPEFPVRSAERVIAAPVEQ